MRILTENELKFQAPSIFSAVAHEKTSSKYQLIPTIDSVRALSDAGFYPVRVSQSKCRNSDNRHFVKHSIRFRRDDKKISIGEMVPEIILTNSHDGTSSYQIRGGIYRLVCSNGLTVGDDHFHRKVKHQGDIISKVVGSAEEIIEIMPEAIETAEEWKGITLNMEAKRVFSESAALLKWDRDEIPLDPSRLLTPKRHGDTTSDLWTTFNVLQENLIRGGQRYYNSNTQRMAKTREVKSINENSRINIALWNLTEKMAEILK